MRITELPTPAVLVDSPTLTRNLSRMQSAANARGLRLRPHAKTHKSPRVAALQIERGAVGICCAKLGEAEVFADQGIADIRLPYPLNPVNADRVFALASRVLLSFIVDDPAVADAWSSLAVARGFKLDVLVKVDTGFHRCGIDPDSPAAPGTVRAIAAMPAEACGDKIAHAREAPKRLRISPKRDAEARHFSKTARKQGRLAIVAERKPFAEARGNADDVLECAGEFDADEIVVRVDA